ncbi:MAG: glycosyltransferase family 25 protein [Mesorhizobium sp.]|nr:MAG: glycosyltransferase family 25 protein [Mesorhizobium sp.]
MRALYINLASSTDRRDWFDAQAVRLGLNIERFDAIASGSIEESVAFRFGVSKSTVACFYSHRAVWNKIANGPDEYVAIFEDDAHLSADLSAFLDDPSWIPADADIVHIEKLGKRFWGIDAGQKAFGRNLYRAISNFCGAAGYIISRDCAAKLYATFTEISRDFDQSLFNDIPGLKFYKIGPALCEQDRFTANPRFPSVIARPNRAKRSLSISLVFREIARVYWRVTSAAVRLFRLRLPRLIAIGVK